MALDPTAWKEVKYDDIPYELSWFSDVTYKRNDWWLLCRDDEWQLVKQELWGFSFEGTALPKSSYSEDEQLCSVLLWADDTIGRLTS